MLNSAGFILIDKSGKVIIRMLVLAFRLGRSDPSDVGFTKSIDADIQFSTADTVRHPFVTH